MIRTKYGGSLLMKGLLIFGMPFYSPITMGKAAEPPLSFISTTYAVGVNPTGIVVGDFNGNGKLDIATINTNDNSISVLVDKSDSATSSRQLSTENAQPQPSPVESSGTENAQPQPSPVESNGNTMTIGISGRISANVSWRSGTDSTGTAAPQSMIGNVSVIFTDIDSGNRKSNSQITIDWGDGAKIKEVIAKKFLTKNFRISGQHVYQKSGSFQATLTIRDSDGLQLTTTQTMVIPSRE